MNFEHLFQSNSELLFRLHLACRVQSNLIPLRGNQIVKFIYILPTQFSDSRTVLSLSLSAMSYQPFSVFQNKVHFHCWLVTSRVCFATLLYSRDIV